MGGCKNVCALRIYEQGISAISERDTRAARVYGDFSEQTVYTPVYEDAFFVVLQPTNGDDVVALLCGTRNTGTDIRSLLTVMILIAHVGQRT